MFYAHRETAQSTMGRRLCAVMRLAGVALLAFCLAACFALAHHDSAYAVKTVNQKKPALVEYDGKNCKVVKNKSLGAYTLKSFETADFNAAGHVYTSLKGTKATLSTSLYLPKNSVYGDLGNPQSFNITPDGQYAYVTYPKPGSKTTGRIIRYDLKKIAELNAQLDNPLAFKHAAEGDSAMDVTGADFSSEFLSCMTVGPWFKFGHGHTFAYNPKDKRLWFVEKTSTNKTNFQRINMTTLKPDLKIKFKFSDNGANKYGTNLAFDKKGNCYFYCYAGGGSSTIPKGSVKLYKGKIKKNKKVEFKLVKTCIKSSSTKKIQSLGYNPKSNRLYMVANSVVMSLPVSKLGKKMKKSDVHQTIFTGKREYEGIAFDNAGNGYLLVNKYPELLSVSKGL